MKIIVVNNPAARTGGALTILKEFLEKISSLNCNNKFYVFVSLEELKKYERKNIKVIVLSQQGFKNRILWDNFGFKNYLKKNNIYPHICLSLQNTGVNISQKVLQIIYYHQPLSIIDFKWNILKKEERVYWMYKNIYPFFVQQYLKRVSKIIVQTKWVKENFSKKFKYEQKNIFLIRPIMKEINISKIKDIPKNKFKIFYPATPLVYKNHEIIIRALFEMKKKNESILTNIECIFTFSKGDSKEIDNMIKKYGLEDKVKLIGKISYEKVLEYYKNCDLMVFPSYLETFGLPLLEASLFNLDIITVNENYAKEVLDKYEKVTYINFDCFSSWAKAITEEYRKKIGD